MDAVVEAQSATGWQHDLYDLLRRNGITQIAYVPDAGHSILIDRSLADPDVHSIPLTTEEEGVALIAGADRHTSLGVDLEKIAVGCGIKHTHTVSTDADVATGARLLRESNGAAFVVARVKPTEPPAFKRNFDAAFCRDRFRAALPSL